MHWLNVRGRTLPLRRKVTNFRPISKIFPPVFTYFFSKHARGRSSDRRAASVSKLYIMYQSFTNCMAKPPPRAMRSFTTSLLVTLRLVIL